MYNVLVVILPILNVISAHDLDLAKVRILLPLMKCRQSDVKVVLAL